MEWDRELLKQFTDGLFRKFLGLILIFGGGAFLWEVAFLEGGQYTGEIMGFVMGVALTTVISFYFGTSQGSVDKSKQIDKLTNGGPDEEN